jgi:hypothetical protein
MVVAARWILPAVFPNFPATTGRLAVERAWEEEIEVLSCIGAANAGIFTFRPEDEKPKVPATQERAKAVYKWYHAMAGYRVMLSRKQNRGQNIQETTSREHSAQVHLQSLQLFSVDKKFSYGRRLWEVGRSGWRAAQYHLKIARIPSMRAKQLKFCNWGTRLVRTEDAYCNI